MTESANLALIRRQYANAGNRAVAEEIMAPDVVWDITPGYPLGGVYTGLDSVLGDFLAPLGARYAALSAHPEQFIEGTNGQVVVLGHYRIDSASGSTTDARFIHIWTIRGHQITRLDQVADSHLAHLALQSTKEH